MSIKIFARATFFSIVIFLGACDRTSETDDKSAESNNKKAGVVVTESKKANGFFDAVFEEKLKRDPVAQTMLGLKYDYDKWTDLSEEHEKESNEIIKKRLAELKNTIKYDLLDEQTKLSYDLFVHEATSAISSFKYRLHNYPVNQMRGMQSGAPAFLINTHTVSSVDDAEAYIARLHGILPMFEQLIKSLEKRAEKGVIAPRFVFKYVLSDSRNIIAGKPFDDSDQDSTLFADIKSKINTLDVLDVEKQNLIEQSKQALRESVMPAYKNFIAYIVELEKQAGTDDGVWRLPDGKNYYSHMLGQYTTTDLTADEIHNIGLREVDRLHQEMRDIMHKVNFEGDLQAFFKFMREDQRFYYSNDTAGKEAYIAEATKLIDTMKSRLDEVFGVKPKADLIVKAVESFREKSAGRAFYQRASADGKRPGIYYANTYDMAQMSKYQMEALAYHEGIPGHHMQLSIAGELEGLPRFRKHANYAFYTSYIEGWGLYSEKLPKQIGMYSDPYSDFGRIAMELWRAVRLVVDTGIHDKGWTHEETIEYIAKTTPDSRADAIKATERYIVLPGQATAYMIGMIKIIELHDYAKKELGDKFDVRDFHDLVLKNSAVTLKILQSLVEDWVASEKVM